MPPNALVRSQASALRKASSGVAASAAPQGLACLTITQAATASRIELRHARKSGIGIGDVVVGQFLALNLPGRGDRGPGAAGGVERRPLVRVFAIAQPVDAAFLPERNIWAPPSPVLRPNHPAMAAS